MFRNDDWLNLHDEDVIDPGREIIDPHHHLWKVEPLVYDLDALQADTQSGHNVVATVFMECGSSYLEDGPDHLKPIGETLYVTDRARQAREQAGVPPIAGIVGHADLRHEALDDILDAHEEAAEGLFRGIRHAGPHEPDNEALSIKGGAPAGLYEDAAFRKGVARLGARGMTYDTWHFHHQNQDYLALAQAVPDTLMVLDHFGTPLGVGPYEGKREEIFVQWKDDIAQIAACPNVVAKIGGLAMPDNGFGWAGRDMPPSSDEFVAAQARYYHHTIECFGPDRCMFESNFPVDRLSLSYKVYWNGAKKIAAQYSEAEQEAMFSGTARRVYRL